MNPESRKHRRVDLSYMARVLGPNADVICDCAIIDVSQGGARIAVLTAEMVPDEFLLALSASSDVTRRCRVAWRKEDEIGVIFVKSVDATAAKRAARRAKLRENPCP